MRLPDDVYLLLEAFAAKVPRPPISDDQGCRDWMVQFAEQVAFSLPGRGYGNKHAGPGRPVSNDVLALQQPAAMGGGLIGWDLWIGVGTDWAAMAPRGVESIDLAGQVFDPAAPVNHLGTVSDPPSQPPAPPDPDEDPLFELDLAPVLERLDTLRDGQVAMLARLDVLVAAQDEFRAAVEQAVAELRTEVARGVRIRF